MYKYKARVLRIVDGDTIDVLIDLVFDVHKKECLHLNNIDAPETHSRDPKEKALGFKAKEFAREFLKKRECLLQITNER